MRISYKNQFFEDRHGLIFKKKLKNIFSRIKSKKTSVHRLGAIFQSGNNGQSSIHVWY